MWWSRPNRCRSAGGVSLSPWAACGRDVVPAGHAPARCHDALTAAAFRQDAPARCHDAPAPAACLSCSAARISSAVTSSAIRALPIPVGSTKRRLPARIWRIFASAAMT